MEIFIMRVFFYRTKNPFQIARWQSIEMAMGKVSVYLARG